jgi:hypothetical protein
VVDGREWEIAGTETFWTKTQAEEHFKPFEDWMKRRGILHLAFWEKQKRGAWHPHVLVNKFCNVNVVREFMVERGWGQIMMFKRVVLEGSHNPRGRGDTVAPAPLARYLIKYLTKAHTCEPRKKFFTGTASCKAGKLTHEGAVAFLWNPYVETPYSFLYHKGLSLFWQLYERLPEFRDVRHCIRLGWEETEWWNFDPFFDP